MLRDDADLARLRHRLRALAEARGADAWQTVRLLTVASELGRNCVVHGGGGHCLVEVPDASAPEVRLTFVDAGPGIADPEAALVDGYSSAGSLGLGLGGSRRLADRFELDSAPGRGTRVSVRLACGRAARAGRPGRPSGGTP